MKAKILCACVLCFIAAISCDKVGNNWAVKIDDEVISMDEFNDLYYTQNRIMLNLDSNEAVDELAAKADTLSPQVQQSVVKANFLDSLVAQKLLYRKALSDPNVDQKQLKVALKLAELQTAASYYQAIRLKGQIEVTDQEVEDFYTANRGYFRGVPLNDDVINRIKQEIFLQKASVASNQYILELVAESKVNKEGFKKNMQTQTKTGETGGTEEQAASEPKQEKQDAPAQ